jgi:hypothetical protein
MIINTKKPFASLILVLFSAIALTLYIFQPHISDGNYLIYFGEFVQSSDFSILAKDKISSFSDRLNLGSYNLGLPVPPQKESVFGTNNGSKVLPLLLFFSTLQYGLGSMWDRFYLIIVLLLPFVVFFKSSRWSGTSYGWAIIGSLIYAFNPWIFLRLTTGFWQLHLAYACLPFLLSYVLFNFKNAQQEHKIKIVVCSALATSIVYLFQPHFLIILLIIITILFSIDHSRLVVFIQNIKYHLLSLLVAILLLVFQIIPSAVYSPYAVTLPNQYLNLASVRFNGATSNVMNVLRLENSGITGSNNTPITPIVILKYGFFVIGLFAIFINIRNKSHRKTALAMLFSLALFSFLSKGLNEPLSFLSEWLYRDLVLLHPFRDPTRFYAGCILVISIAVSQLRVNRYIAEKLVLVIYVWFIVLFPFMLVDFIKSINFIKIPVEYSQELLSSTSSAGRLSYFPQNMLLSNYSWYENNTSVGTQTSLLDSIVATKIGLAQYSGYPDSYLAQLMLYGYTSATSSSSFPLSILSVDTVKIDENIQNNQSAFAEVNNWKEFLSDNSQVDLISYRANISTYKITPEKIINDKSILFVVGNLNTFSNVYKMIGDKYTVILLNQAFNIANFIKMGGATIPIIFEDEGELNNLWLNQYREQFALPMAELVWDYDQDWNLNEPYISQEIVKGTFFNSGRSIVSLKKNDQLNYSTKKIRGGKYRLAISYYGIQGESPLRVVINEAEEDLPSNRTANRFEWFISSSIQISDNESLDITLFNLLGEKLIVDNVLLIPEEIIISEKNKYEKLIEDSMHISIQNVGNYVSDPKTSILIDDSELKYTKISDTRYSYSSSKDWITIRIPFDIHWVAGKSSPSFIGDYYGMVFANDSVPADVPIYYKPELIFEICLYISGVTFLILMLLLIKTFLPKNIV